jgi:2,4-dienoyl-CoA reductase-like NADH-dependent reductase (Old Yellow Enzyme family)
MAHPPISKPKGPSAIDIPGLNCRALTADEIGQIPGEFARTSRLAQELGFGGVQIHAAHGFLLSQFLSPLFNKRDDAYGGSTTARMRLLLEVVDAVRSAVDPGFVVGVKLNATDQLDGGFEEKAAIEVIAALDNTEVDFIDISGGTYFPGAKSSSDNAGSGPYFSDFASYAKKKTSKPIMMTGGIKTKQHAVETISMGNVDLIGIARALVLDPNLPKSWNNNQPNDPEFPRFASRAEGGVTAWYTMLLTELAEGRDMGLGLDLEDSLRRYNARDEARVRKWIEHFR